MESRDRSQMIRREFLFHLPDQLRSPRLFDWASKGLIFLALTRLALKQTEGEILFPKIAAEQTVGERSDFGEIMSKIKEISDLINPVEKGSSDLFKIWEETYRKWVTKTKTEEKEECYPSTNSSGTPTVKCEKKTVETEYQEPEWFDPPEFKRIGLTHNTINDWEGFFGNLANKTALLRNKASSSFDLAPGLNALYYPKDKIDLERQRLGVIPVYTLLAGVYSFYEKIINKLAENFDGIPSIDDGKRITRRGFLKLLGAGGLSLAIGRLGFKHPDNDRLMVEVQNYSRQVLSQLDVSPEVNFQRFFGVLPNEMRNQLLQIEDIINKALKSGYNGGSFIGFYFDNEKIKAQTINDSNWGKNNGVKEHLEKLKQQAREAREQFDHYFHWDESTGKYQIPSQLTLVTSYLWATQQMESFVRRKFLNIKAVPYLNALLLGMGLCGVGLLTEGLVLPATDAVLDKM